METSILRNYNPLQNSPSRLCKPGHNLSYVSLPPLQLLTFNECGSKFQFFWDQFNYAVHTNPQLHPVMKFLYLLSCLQGKT